MAKFSCLYTHLSCKGYENLLNFFHFIKFDYKKSVYKWPILPISLLVIACQMDQLLLFILSFACGVAATTLFTHLTDEPKPKPQPTEVPKPKPQPTEVPKPKPQPTDVPKPKPQPTEVPKPKPQPIEVPKPQPMSLYNEGLSMTVPFRTSRADITGCKDERDYAAKLFGIRLAFQRLMDRPQTVQWLISSGRMIFAALLRQDRRNTAKFYIAYNNMINFMRNEKNQETIHEELRDRQIPTPPNLWDVLIDMFILGALRDLQQRKSTAHKMLMLIPTTMKRTALDAMINRQKKAKRNALRVKDGFVSRCYDVTDELANTLAAGLFGASGNKKFEDVCGKFKDQVYQLIIDMFNANTMRFTKVEELTEDVDTLLKECIGSLKEMLKVT